MGYPKLVRDKIPEIIESEGHKVHVRTLSDDEFVVELRRKLMEEVREYLEEPSSHELADVFAVVCELADIHIPNDDFGLLNIEIEKRKERGGFKGRKFLMLVEEAP